MKCFLTIYTVLIISQMGFSQDEIKTKPRYDIFAFDKEVTLPGTPEQIFDAATGDISAWWDPVSYTHLTLPTSDLV
mgnify:CR=1 FL=1